MRVRMGFVDLMSEKNRTVSPHQPSGAADESSSSSFTGNIASTSYCTLSGSHVQIGYI